MRDSLSYLILSCLLALTVKQLASLQENGLYLLRILFEISMFFSSSSDCLLKLIAIPICHNCYLL